jgi:hypothetical protein
MNVMIALPGDRYFAVPREVLEKYAVDKASFDKDVEAKWKAGDAVFQSEVEGQEDADSGGSGGGGSSDWNPPPDFTIRTSSAVMGVRG